MKTRTIPDKAPFVSNQLKVNMTAEESRRFDEAVKKAGMFKARIVRNLIVEWTDSQLGATAPKAK